VLARASTLAGEPDDVEPTVRGGRRAADAQQVRCTPGDVVFEP
jgi:hypothetical protein